MKKELLSILLILSMLLCSVAFADDDVDTSDWQYYTFEGTGIMLKIPTNFTLRDEEGALYCAGTDTEALEVYAEEEDYASLQDIAKAYKGNLGVEDVEIKSIGGIDVVEFEGVDDDLEGFLVLSPEGTTYRFMLYYNLGEDGKEIPGSEDIMEAVKDSMVPSDWQYYTFEGSGVALMLPTEFEDKESATENVLFCRGTDTEILEVTSETEDYSSLKEIKSAYKANAAVKDVEIETINGIEVVTFEGEDDYVEGFLVLSPEGTTYRFTLYYNLSENGAEIPGSEEIVEAIEESLIGSEKVSQ